MTRIKCNFKAENGSGEGVYCRFRSEDGYCTKEEITIENGPEGYALFEPCCQDYDIKFDKLKKEEVHR
ncbi:MAG: hypothetical protein J7K62_02395 [Thermoplasmata archaeon]|nr:hypothetical protein [Thermoplasmata archaeon]